MATIYLPAMRRIWQCFFFSLGFAIVAPIICISLGVEVHPREFHYRSSSSSPGDNSASGSEGNENQIIYLHADLMSADLKKGTVVLDWSIVDDSCYYTDYQCTSANIYFDANLLQQSTTSTGGGSPSNNNCPTDPTFIWNITADMNDTYSNYPMFQTMAIIFNPFSLQQSQNKHPISHSHTSNVYYPFDHYTAVVFCHAEEGTTNDPINLRLNDTGGLVGSLQITAEVVDPSEFSSDDVKELVFVQISLQRSTLVIWYCIVITITFWLVTLTICLIMIMTVGFRFRQRNEIVVVPVTIVFAFVQLHSTMPGAPDGFGDILDFVGVLPCLVLLSICVVTMVGIYIFTDPTKESRRELTWSGLVQALCRGRKSDLERKYSSDSTLESYDMLSGMRV
ncbi:hypothetical protein IW261DRAFT_1528442 [Armillaria novae-zelandiae]|uniref:Uncharacterized protein n=1 Tax=Armillaria novae-zelandiae TaxID=153914 RepID=A0AA39TX98_9AGAR|nr:hypothetical protein IW261DRAFT_1528442 [Armillaria novae-zelandiae]